MKESLHEFERNCFEKIRNPLCLSGEWSVDRQWDLKTFALKKEDVSWNWSPTVFVSCRTSHVHYEGCNQVFMQNPCLMLKDTRCQCLMHFRSWLALGEHAKEKLHKFLCLAGQRQKCEVSWSVEFWQLQCLLTLRPSPGGSLSFVRPQANQVGDHHHKESPMFRSVKWSQKTKGKCLGNPSPKTGASKKRVLPVLCKTVPDSLAPFFV